LVCVDAGRGDWIAKAMAGFAQSNLVNMEALVVERRIRFD
jgi:hypothetical protein